MAETNTSTTKRCTKCRNEFSVEFFHRDKNRPDGRFPWCKPCIKDQQQEIYQANRERELAKRRAHYQATKDEYKARAKKWVLENPEKRKEASKKYSGANPEKRYELGKKSRLNNPGMYAAHYKMRQTRKRNAMPDWADVDAIKAIYRQCAFVTRFTGVKHHVDHFYPLKNDVVCGLHNEFNLRIIPATDNLSKGNSFPG